LTRIDCWLWPVDQSWPVDKSWPVWLSYQMLTRGNAFSLSRIRVSSLAARLTTMAAAPAGVVVLLRHGPWREDDGCCNCSVCVLRCGCWFARRWTRMRVQWGALLPWLCCRENEARWWLTMEEDGVAMMVVSLQQRLWWPTVCANLAPVYHSDGSRVLQWWRREDARNRLRGGVVVVARRGCWFRRAMEVADLWWREWRRCTLSRCWWCSRRLKMVVRWFCIWSVVWSASSRWCSLQVRERRRWCVVVAGRGAAMVREGCGNGGCCFRRVAVVAGEEMAATAPMVGGREIRVRVSCVRWRRWWHGKIWVVNLVSGGLWHVAAYGWLILKGGDCHMAWSGWVEFKW